MTHIPMVVCWALQASKLTVHYCSKLWPCHHQVAVCSRVLAEHVLIELIVLIAVDVLLLVAIHAFHSLCVFAYRWRTRRSDCADRHLTL